MPDNKSDAKWYFDQANDKENLEYYRIFSSALSKYNVQWCNATEREKYFIEEVVRVELEREKAKKYGYPLSSIVPAFSYEPVAH